MMLVRASIWFALAWGVVFLTMLWMRKANRQEWEHASMTALKALLCTVVAMVIVFGIVFFF